MTEREPVLIPAIAVACCLVNPTLVSAQAWPSPKGEGSVSIFFQHIDFSGHFFPDGSRVPIYQTRSNNLVVGVDYAFTDRLSVSTIIPYVNTRFTGEEEPFNLPINVVDDGSYHGALQDFRLELRYNPIQRPLFVTPYFAAVIPSHSYEIIGEAATGRHLREFLVGSYAGRLLNPVLPRAYVQGLYSYAFVERDAGIPLDRSSAALEFGYFLTSSVSLSFLWAGQWTHGGLDFSQIFDTPEIHLNHDRLVRANFQHVGIAGGIVLSESLFLDGSVTWFASGSNTHYGSASTVAVTWIFQTRREPSADVRSGAARFTNERMLARTRTAAGWPPSGRTSTWHPPLPPIAER